MCNALTNVAPSVHHRWQRAAPRRSNETEWAGRVRCHASRLEHVRRCMTGGNGCEWLRRDFGQYVPQELRIDRRCPCDPRARLVAKTGPVDGKRRKPASKFLLQW